MGRLIITGRDRWSRRRVLKGLLGGATATVALPLLEVFTAGKSAYAQGAFPTRFGLFFWGNGMLPERWVPSGEGSGDAWSLSEQLMPLASVKRHLTVISGTELKHPNEIPHYSGMSAVLTGAKVVIKSHAEQTMPSPTIDQLVAAEIGGETRFRSLETACFPRELSLSYNGPDNPNPPEIRPTALFERLFGAGFRAPGEEAEVDPKLALRRSVLDAVMEDITAFKRDIGAADRVRLDQHLTGVRELERRIARLEEDPPQLDACARPDAPEGDFPDIDGQVQLVGRNRAICDVLTMALACDQTRVFSHMITKPLLRRQLAGSDAGHHQLTHDEPDPQPQVNMITKALMAELTYLIEQLAGVPEGDGTLLDHTLLMATSDVSLGRLHSLDEYPLLLAGTANGRIKTDFHYRSGFAENTSDALLSVVRAVGLNADAFGDGPGESTTALTAIER